jgi:hypothetical protein
MGKSGSRNNDRQFQPDDSNQENTSQLNTSQQNPNQRDQLKVNAPGGVSIQILGMDIKVSDLDITIGPDTNIREIQSIIDQLNRRG